MLISSPSRVISRVLAVGAALILTLFALLVTVPAGAHSALLGTDPEDGQQLASAPEEVSLTFNEDITDLGTQVVISTEDGETVSEGEVQIDGPVITQALADTRPEGAYTVTWRAVSADGHPISGEFTFTAAEGVGAEAETADTSTDPSVEGEEGAQETQDAQELAEEPEQNADQAEAADEDSGLSAGTWVIIGILIVAAIIIVTVLARGMGASKRQE